LQKGEILKPRKLRATTLKKTMAKPNGSNFEFYDIDNKVWNVALDNHEDADNDMQESYVGNESDREDASIGKPEHGLATCDWPK
jgi:hypothetical protein